MITTPGFLPAAATRSAVPAMVSTQWLCDHLGSDTMVILDARGFGLPDDLSEARCTRIPGALFADRISVDAAAFHRMAEHLGITSGATVVVYDRASDTTPGAASPAQRLQETFAIFGYERVSVLVGGFPKWNAEDRPVEAAADSAAA
ncbi:rhodanese-like domain-containing protein [Subtercola boreus]|uniref:rhodanese-like domain-containing protein n=1 Tax=Subtercola boreus TaxID=120213 RepID=UPI0015592854|nr:rhodanese-like domain-containing protein [Subtercola boreus]